MAKMTEEQKQEFLKKSGVKEASNVTRRESIAKPKKESKSVGSYSMDEVSAAHEPSAKAAPKGKSFKQAFAEARKTMGMGKTFEWNGKKYTTDRADDKKPAPVASAPAESMDIKDYSDESTGAAYRKGGAIRGWGKARRKTC